MSSQIYTSRRSGRSVSPQRMGASPRPTTYIGYDQRMSYGPPSATGSNPNFSHYSASIATSEGAATQLNANTAFNARPSLNLQIPQPHSSTYPVNQRRHSIASPMDYQGYVPGPTPSFQPNSHASKPLPVPPVGQLHPSAVPSMSRRPSTQRQYAPSYGISPGPGPSRSRPDREQRRAIPNYPGVSQAPHTQMDRTLSRSRSTTHGFGHVREREDMMYGSSVSANVVKFKRKGARRSGIALEEAMYGVRISGKHKYLLTALHVDERKHLMLKISWPGYQSQKYLVPVKAIGMQVDLQTLVRRIARACHHYLDAQRIVLVWERVCIHRIEETSHGVWQALMTTH